MGEQSVGKSFTLNHLVDTSFAGSAMRTTGLFRAIGDLRKVILILFRGRLDVRFTNGECADRSAGFRRWAQMRDAPTMVKHNLKFLAQQAFTVSSVQPRKTRFSSFLTLLFRTSCVNRHLSLLRFQDL